jgi:hypothetical protein
MYEARSPSEFISDVAVSCLLLRFSRFSFRETKKRTEDSKSSIRHQTVKRHRFNYRWYRRAALPYYVVGYGALTGSAQSYSYFHEKRSTTGSTCTWQRAKSGSSPKLGQIINNKQPDTQNTIQQIHALLKQKYHQHG